MGDKLFGNPRLLYWALNYRESRAAYDDRGRELFGASGRAILIELAFTSDPKGCCWLGQQAIAERCAISRRTVFNWLKHFESEGLLTRERRFLEGAGRDLDCLILHPTNAALHSSA